MRMRSLMGLSIIVASAVSSGYAQPRCGSINIGSDRMGIRVKDRNGYWEYITPGSSIGVTLVRFSNLSYFGIRIKPADAKEIFGDCALVYEAVLSAVVPIYSAEENGKPRAGQKIPIFPANISPQNAFFMDMKSHGVFLYTTSSSGLVIANKRYYAVADEVALCEFALCKETDIERLSGAVREAVAWVVGKGGKKVRNLSATFVDGRLKLDIEIEAAGGRERMTFHEKAAGAK